MSVSMDDVRKALEAEEPDYEAAARLGADSLPYLRDLVGGDDLMLASKAAYAAGLLEGDAGQDVIAVAAQSENPVLRVAAASASANLPAESAVGLLTDLVADPDPGVRKVAMSSVPADAPEELAERVREAVGNRPGEAAAEDSGPAAVPDATPMPGEGPGSGRMPGEGAAATGLMPGEEPDGRGMRDDTSSSAPGKMPGEA